MPFKRCREDPDWIPYKRKIESGFHSQTQESVNQPRKRHRVYKSSAYNGVSFDTTTKCWKAARTLQGKQFRKSGFVNEVDAAKAADDILRENNAYSRKFNFPSRRDTKLRRLAKLALTKHGYFGVSRVGDLGWKAQRYCAGKQIQSKTFTSKEFAAHKSDEIWRQHAGAAFDEAMLNFPDVVEENTKPTELKKRPQQSMDFSGVTWDPKVGKYRAEHVINNNRCFGGFFVSQEAAAVGADELLRKHGIHFGKLNFPKRGEWKHMRNGSHSITPTPSPPPFKATARPQNGSITKKVITAKYEDSHAMKAKPKCESLQTAAQKPTREKSKSWTAPPPLEKSITKKIPVSNEARDEILKLCGKNRILREKCKAGDAEIGRLRQELKNADAGGMQVLLDEKNEELQRVRREVQTAKRRLEHQETNFSRRINGISQKHHLEVDELKQENDELKMALENLQKELLNLRCVE